MFPVTDMAVRPIAEIDRGNLILFPFHDKYRAAIRVQFVGSTEPAALLLEPIHGAPPAPLCINTKEPCVDLGRRPVMLWSGLPQALVDWQSQIPPAGHLVVMGSDVLISGNLALGGGFSGANYWNLATGLPDQGPRTASASLKSFVYVTEWCASALNVQGESQTVASFPFAVIGR